MTIPRSKRRSRCDSPRKAIRRGSTWNTACSTTTARKRPRCAGSLTRNKVGQGSSKPLPASPPDRQSRSGAKGDREHGGNTMSDITHAHKTLVARVLEGDGRASPAQRRAAFDNAGLAEPLRTLIDKDIASAKAAGLGEDHIFELAVCAAIGQATRQYETALAALEAATERSGHAPRNPR